MSQFPKINFSTDTQMRLDSDSVSLETLTDTVVERQMQRSVVTTECHRRPTLT